MSDELIKVENLRRIDVRPGDRFVLMVDQEISMQTRDPIMEVWKEFMGGEVPLLVLPNGAEIGVIRSQED